ncbi:hypothetical protein KDM41_08575 [bacterium]|nr:hypothetical protein [bacterium]
MTSRNRRRSREPAFRRIRDQELALNPSVSHRPRRYSESGCAAACLARVLERHGLPVEPAEIESRLCASPLTGDVVNFLEVAEQLGLQGFPRVLTSEEWPSIPSGSILHWGPDQLVVCEETTPDGYVVYDPRRGALPVDQPTFRRLFTGVALVFLRAAEEKG